MSNIINNKFLIKKLLSVVIMLCGYNLFAQYSINSSGRDITSISGSISYSVGQTFINVLKDSTVSVTQGVQQPFALVSTSLNENITDLKVLAHPNPTNNIIKITALTCCTRLDYQVYNVYGILLISGVISFDESEINVSELPVATYFLRITDEKNNVQVIKFMKL